MFIITCNINIDVGVLKVSNDRYASKILLNADIPEVNEFRKRYSHVLFTQYCTMIY